MARAMLHDDYKFYRASGTGIALDDDSRSSVPAGINGIGYGDHVPGSPVTNPTVVNPLVTVRQRYLKGTDEDGNPEYGWHTLFEDREAIRFESRSEVSDSTGLALVKSSVTVLYPADQPLVRETATVLTNDGNRWQVTKVERFPDRLQLDMERIDNG